MESYNDITSFIDFINNKKYDFITFETDLDNKNGCIYYNWDQEIKTSSNVHEFILDLRKEYDCKSDNKPYAPHFVCTLLDRGYLNDTKDFDKNTKMILFIGFYIDKEKNVVKMYSSCKHMNNITKEFIKLSIAHFMSRKNYTEYSTIIYETSIRDKIIDDIKSLGFKEVYNNENNALGLITFMYKIFPEKLYYCYFSRKDITNNEISLYDRRTETLIKYKTNEKILYDKINRLISKNCLLETNYNSNKNYIDSTYNFVVLKNTDSEHKNISDLIPITYIGYDIDEDFT
jgi:hypothetical protein